MNIACVLTRVPCPGQGKTRLRRQLGDSITDRLTAAFLTDVLSWCGASADEVLIAHRGPQRHLPPLGCGQSLIAQPDGDLGTRISAAVDSAFGRGADRVVVIGSDCPSLPAALLDAAFEALDGAASTLIPAADGGWVALGVRRPLGGTLRGVAWGTAGACADTAAVLTADGRPPLMLPAWYDIDELADLERLRRDPSLAVRAPRTHAVLGEIPAMVA